jgi:uncharacterized repeat protein (TIGR03803 family)
MRTLGLMIATGLAAAPFAITAHAASETIIYAFKGGADGSNPSGSLLNVRGTLYGITHNGGTGCNNICCGTVFKITPDGGESVLHSFGIGSDGCSPDGSLIDVDGVLYGTTSDGGGSGCQSSGGCGTVFKITKAGAEQVIYTFKGGKDGNSPVAGLVDVSGTLYGTTFDGGSLRAADCYDRCGTVFGITTAGVKTVLYRFKGGKDGGNPGGPLVNVNGTLYGTTFRAGLSGCFEQQGCGTVFSITTAGAEKVVYRFKGLDDAGAPSAGLINLDGTLYGTSSLGGGTGCANGYGCGTVFSVTPAGVETVLHSFAANGDGAFPYAGLLNVRGVLYGTTSNGGIDNAYGTVFSLTPSGLETILYSFPGPFGASSPAAGLIDVDGTLYGTTVNGGQLDAGTVYSITP